MNYLEYIKHLEEKERFWIPHAEETLNNPKATYYECKAAIIGVRKFSRELAERLEEKSVPLKNRLRHKYR